MDSYCYQPCDYSSFGAIPPLSTPTDFEFSSSSIFDPNKEDDQQLLLDLQSFLCDSISPASTDPYFNNLPVPHHTETQFHLPPPPPVQDQFLLDFDYSALFQCEPLFSEPEESFYITESDDYYFSEPAPKRQKRFHYEPPPPPPPPPQPQYNNCCFLAPAPEVFQKQGSLCGCSKAKETGARATAQSVAARDRRKKISDKTQELGKLVPGASNSKMNTAEMLHSAYKYVKFLQAQVSVLQLLASDSSNQDGKKRDELKILASREVQEKLYMKEKCIVPMEFLEELAEKDDVEKTSSIAEDLKQLVKKAVSVEDFSRI